MGGVDVYPQHSQGAYGVLGGLGFVLWAKEKRKGKGKVRLRWQRQLYSVWKNQTLCFWQEGVLTFAF